MCPVRGDALTSPHARPLSHKKQIPQQRQSRSPLDRETGRRLEQQKHNEHEKQRQDKT